MSVSNNIVESIKKLFYMQKDSQLSFVSKSGKYFILFSSFIGAALIMLSFYPNAYKPLIREDGLIEYLSSLFWLLSIITLFITISLTYNNQKKFRVTYLFLMVFFIVCCGEEISWGQRLIPFKGPDVIIKLNKQGEFNLHNIGTISIYSNLFFLLTLTFFLVYPMILLSNKKVKTIVIDNKLPVVVYYAVVNYLVILSVWIIIGIRFGTLGFHPFSLWGYYTQMDDEIFEFFAAFSFFTFAVLDLLFKYRNNHLKVKSLVPHQINLDKSK